MFQTLEGQPHPQRRLQTRSTPAKKAADMLRRLQTTSTPAKKTTCTLHTVKKTVCVCECRGESVAAAAAPRLPHGWMRRQSAAGTSCNQRRRRRTCVSRGGYPARTRYSKHIRSQYIKCIEVQYTYWITLHRGDERAYREKVVLPQPGTVYISDHTT